MSRRIRNSGLRLLAALCLGTATFGVVGSLNSLSQEAAASFPSCGTVILSGSSWLGGGGVNVYSNGSDEGTGTSCGGTSTVNGITAGSEWQCVELVNRLYLTKGWISSHWSGDGDTLYANAPGNLSKQANGSVSYLGPGDVLSIDVDDSGSPLDGGHALIVNDSSDVSSGTVQLVSQNGASNQSPTATATISNGTVTIPSSGDYSYPVIGVIHAPNSAPPPPPPPPQSGTDLLENGGFNGAWGGWAVVGGSNFAVYSNGQVPGVNAYEGSGYAATNTSASGGGIYQDVAATIDAGNTYCASAEVVTDGKNGGGGGTLTVWLLGGSSNDQSSYSFSNLPGGSAWTPISTCVTATTSQNDIRVQFYPNVNGPTIGIDAVDTHLDLLENGGFNGAWGGWAVVGGSNFAVYSNGQVPGVNAYEGSGYAATNTSASGGGIYQDVAATIDAGNTYCASAEVVTDGKNGGGGGTLTVWLLGGSSNDQSSYSFSNLPGGSAWTPISTCVTATTSQNDIRVQFYPNVNGPTIGIDAVDTHLDLLENGGFNGAWGGWAVVGGSNFAVYSNGQVPGVNAYEGSGYAATNTSASGGGIYQDVAATIDAGNTYCASAEVVTDGKNGGGGGTLTVWLLGGSSNDQSSYSFSNLPGGSAWTPISTCVTATTSQNDIRVQFYPNVNGPTIGIDAVDTQAKGFGAIYQPPSGGGGSSGGGSSGPTPPVTSPSSDTSHGYWLVGSDGGIFSFGSAQFYGSMGGIALQRPVVGIVPTRDRGGYWLDASDGGVFSFGDTQFYGSIPGLGLNPAGSGKPNSLNAPIVGMVPSHDQGGYFMVASDGGVFAFGDAHFAGSCPGIGGCSGAAVAVMPDASGNGYWLVTATGNVYTFGDAPNLGAPGPQSSPITSAVATPDGGGYYIVDAAGQVFSYGDAKGLGSVTPGAVGGFNPASAIFVTSDNAGYWVSDALGDVYTFGDAPNDGSMAGTHLNGSIIAASGS